MKRHYLKSLLSLATLALFLSCSDEVENSTSDLEAVSAKAKIGKNYMVILQQEEIPANFEQLVLENGGKVKSLIPEIGIVVVSAESSDFDAKMSALSEVRSVVPDLDIQWIEPRNNFPEASPLSIGSDEPFFNFLWGMDAINAPEAWNLGYTGEGVRVFVLDEGIDAEHPDLAPNLNTELSTSFINGEDWNVRPGFYFNHGTHVAGTIAAADNEFGVIGVAPSAEIVAVKVLSEFTGSGPFSSINAGIVYAGANGADVINMSLGATLNKNGLINLSDGSTVKIPGKFISEIRHAQQRAVNFAYRNGATIVTSAGNGGRNTDGNKSEILLPSGLNNVIAVSATAPDNWALDQNTDLDVPTSYTDYGRNLITVSAPGGDFDQISVQPLWYFDMVLSTISEGWSWSAGTSMASPHVAGVAALIIGKNGGQMAPHEVTKQIINSADKVDGNGQSLYHGKGRVSALNAVSN